MPNSTWRASNKSAFHPVNLPPAEPSAGLEIHSRLLFPHMENRHLWFTSTFFFCFLKHNNFQLMFPEGIFDLSVFLETSQTFNIPGYGFHWRVLDEKPILILASSVLSYNWISSFLFFEFPICPIHWFSFYPICPEGFFCKLLWRSSYKKCGPCLHGYPTLYLPLLPFPRRKVGPPRGLYVAVLKYFQAWHFVGNSKCLLHHTEENGVLEGES